MFCTTITDGACHQSRDHAPGAWHPDRGGGEDSLGEKSGENSERPGKQQGEKEALSQFTHFLSFSPLASLLFGSFGFSW